MARTYRRKKASSPFPDYWRELDECIRDWYRKRHHGMTDEEIVRKKCVEYHKENHPGEWNVPGGYGKWLNKKVKNRNRLTLIRDLRNDGEFDMIPIKKDSGWQYW